MDFKSKIKEAIEESLKKEPEYLGEKQLVFFENEKVDYFKNRENVVEVYLESHIKGSYFVHILGVEYINDICNLVEEELKKREEGCLITAQGHPVEDDCILITITE